MANKSWLKVEANTNHVVMAQPSRILPTVNLSSRRLHQIREMGVQTRLRTLGAAIEQPMTAIVLPVSRLNRTCLFGLPINFVFLLIVFILKNHTYIQI